MARSNEVCEVEWLTGCGNTVVDLSTVNVTDNVVGEVDKIFDSITVRQFFQDSRII